MLLYSVKSKLFLISKYNKTIDKVFRGNFFLLIIINDCPIHRDFLTALSLNTFFQSKWRKLSMISWNLVDMTLVLNNNQNMEWLKALHLSPSVATKSATYAYQVIDTLGYSYRLLFLDIRRKKIHTCTWVKWVINCFW